jgi:hypothetical protein
MTGWCQKGGVDCRPHPSSPELEKDAGYCNLVFEKLFLRAFLVALSVFYSLSTPNSKQSRAILLVSRLRNTWSMPLWHVLLVSMYQTTSTP